MRALLLALVLIPGTPPPDLLLPGHKSVRHELILDWGEESGRFIAYPTRGFHGPHEIERGKPFRFSSKYGTKIYAVPADAVFPEDREAATAVAWPRARVPVGEVRSIPASNPLAHVLTTARITAVTANGIEFKILGERRMDGSGNEIGNFDWVLLVLVASVGVAMLLVLNRRAQRADPTPA